MRARLARSLSWSWLGTVFIPPVSRQNLFDLNPRAGACRLLVDSAISHYTGSQPHGCIQAAGRGTLGRAAGNEDNVAGHQLYIGTLRGQNLLELDADLLLTLRRLADDLRLVESGGAIYSFRH